VLRPAVARARPQPYAPVVARIPTRTPEGTTNILLVIGAHRDGTGGLWVQVRLPILPNNTTGWVRRSALGGYRFVRTRLVVDLRSLEATLYRGRATLLHVPVGVGTKATPTPVGSVPAGSSAGTGASAGISSDSSAPNATTSAAHNSAPRHTRDKWFIKILLLFGALGGPPDDCLAASGIASPEANVRWQDDGMSI